MRRSWTRAGLNPRVCAGVGFLAVVLGLAADDPGAKPAGPQPDAVSIPETQLTIRLGRKQFQATAVGKSKTSLTIVTAAHCIAPQEVGATIALSQGRSAFLGKITSSSPNPDYQPVVSRDPQNKGVRGVLCVDNAVATIEVNLRNERETSAFQAVKTAEITQSAMPGAMRSATMVVHIIDQRGDEHAVRAGNHLNPKCLAWGNASFRPLPGDSGAGVFFVRETAAGKAAPVLIGNVALSDDRGGIAPLLSRKNAWVGQALSTSAPEPAAAR